MNNIEKLEAAISGFFCKKAYEYGYDLDSARDLLAELDFPTIYQNIRRDAQDVYAYQTSGTLTAYHSKELFPGKATLIFRDYDFAHDFEDSLETNHFLELWVKEDMTLAVVACHEVRYLDEEYVTAFREYKGEEWPDSSMYLELGCLIIWLTELCEVEEEIPFFFEP